MQVMWRRRLIGFGVVVLLGAGVVFVLGWHGAIKPVAQPRGFPAEAVARGAALAAIGDCAICHTRLGGAPYAGGRPLETPFGVIYSGNITPDIDTGLGHWSEKAFNRAMLRGVDRSGSHLYPAFPYDHFSHVTGPDLHALYAFLMTRQPVSAKSPANDLPFPIDVRAFVAEWNLLFLHPGPVPPDPKHDAVWNRGAYLVEGLGHCGACHSARNALGAESGDRFGGGAVDGWYAPALGPASPAPTTWTEAEVFAYLRGGLDDRHGAAAGPMQPVVHALAVVPDADLHAMSTYVASFSTAMVPAPKTAMPVDAAGEAIFAGACAACHAPSSPMSLAGRPSLSLSTTMHAPDARNARQIIRFGIRPAPGQAGPLMPGFADVLTDAQLDSLLDYLRARFADAPPWKRLASKEAP